MPPPVSVFNQAKVFAVPAWSLMPSPRNYNSSLIEFDGRRLMAYRSHRMDQNGRCGIVICRFGTMGSWEADSDSNAWLNLPEQVHSRFVHHEDPRLFEFKGRLHVAYTETQFHPAPQPYTCVMKYARLRERKGKWDVERVFHPRFGRNDGSNQEKNWQFFDDDGELRFIYQAEPHHVATLGKDGETVVDSTKSEGGVKWPWGTIRGGTPPIRVGKNDWLTVFHSSTPHPFPPHWRRYYAGAYTFEGKAPFRIKTISQQPILIGSEADGHAYDPRNIDSWKPFVVFPSGIMDLGRNTFAVSYGINDHMTAIAEHPVSHGPGALNLGDPSFAAWGPKYFRTGNASAPVRYFTHEDRPPTYLRWEPAGTSRAGQQDGVLCVTDPRIAMIVAEIPAAEEITAAEYTNLKN